MTEAYVFDAVRTPRGKGKKDGSLHEVKPVDLLAGTLDALRRRHDGGIPLQQALVRVVPADGRGQQREAQRQRAQPQATAPAERRRQRLARRCMLVCATAGLHQRPRHHHQHEQQQRRHQRIDHPLPARHARGQRIGHQRRSHGQRRKRHQHNGKKPRCRLRQPHESRATPGSSQA